MAAHISTVPNSRLRAMVVPREHGAWGMMLVPLATGAVVAARTAVNSTALVVLLIAAISLFWLRTPLESWLGTSAIKAQTDYERGLLTKAIVAIGAVAAGNVAALLWNGHNRGLLIIGAIAALAFAAQAGVKKLGRKGRMPAQIIGAIGLTSTAAVRLLRRHWQTRPHGHGTCGWRIGYLPPTKSTSFKSASTPAGPDVR